MSKQEKGLVPELRFPEFANEGGWKRKPIGYGFKRVTTKNTENNQNALTISAQQGLVSQLDYFNKKVAAKDLSGYYLLHKADFAYNKSYSQGYPMGAIKPLKLYEKGVVSTLYICFRANKGFCNEFYEHYFEAGMLNQQIQSIAQEGGRAHGLLNVSVKEFFNDVDILVPTIEEQQKIADCLASVDELIVLHTQKLDALKDHKKGLMQRLFPADGETMPELRFQEFKRSGEWTIRSIEESCEKTFSGGTPTSTNKDYYGGDIPFIRSGEIDKSDTELFLTEEGLSRSSAKMVKKGDVLIALYGANSGEVALSKIDGAINQAILCLRSNTNNPFLYQILGFKKDQITAKYLQGGQGNLSGDIIRSIKLAFPDENEQERIASFLESIDKLIAAQCHKLNGLIGHKKGLIQKLFPPMDDAV